MRNETSRFWPIDPTRPILTVADARLQRLLLNDPMRCASISEYSAATGIDISKVIDLFAEHLDSGAVTLETSGGEIFVHTSPNGRGAHEVLQVPPNLWEFLRRGGSTGHAFTLWRLVRELEAAGWAVEADPKRIPATASGEVALVGLRLGSYVAPLVLLPKLDELAHPAGVLSRFERRGVPLVGVICNRGDLDASTTAVRKWMLTRPAATRVDILVLEAPRHQPVLLGGADAAVAPRTVTRELLEALIADADAPDGVDPSAAPR